ncbi:hypothetical protein XcvCFBP7113P_19590 [Xanthomonas citri pv. vignicola]|nr:hypothetical protein XcvCFBP7113P_19590 [Xanthomonas citri pv. vignicola]
MHKAQRSTSCLLLVAGSIARKPGFQPARLQSFEVEVVSPPIDLDARIAPWETLTLRDACAVATAGTND